MRRLRISASEWAPSLVFDNVVYRVIGLHVGERLVAASIACVVIIVVIICTALTPPLILSYLTKGPIGVRLSESIMMMLRHFRNGELMGFFPALIPERTRSQSPTL